MLEVKLFHGEGEANPPKVLAEVRVGENRPTPLDEVEVALQDEEAKTQELVKEAGAARTRSKS